MFPAAIFTSDIRIGRKSSLQKLRFWTSMPARLFIWKREAQTGCSTAGVTGLTREYFVNICTGPE
jgi:hypothetical protein